MIGFGVSAALGVEEGRCLQRPGSRERLPSKDFHADDDQMKILFAFFCWRRPAGPRVTTPLEFRAADPILFSLEKFSLLHPRCSLAHPGLDLRLDRVPFLYSK
jgi:hypothetical protein